MAQEEEMIMRPGGVMRPIGRPSPTVNIQAPPQQQPPMPPQQYPPFGGNGGAGGGHTPTAPPNTFSPNFNYGNGSPLHSGFDRVKGGPSPSHMGGVGPTRNTSGADDVTTKSISGLESLVDQIPAIAENDSGVFSGSGAGSHPNTPRYGLNF